MIRKRKSRKESTVRVTFELPAEVANDSVFVVGDFNDWDKNAHPMKRLRKGSWKKDIYLEAGKSYQFRYYIDGGTWRNDSSAAASEEGHSVIDTGSLEPAEPNPGPSRPALMDRITMEPGKRGGRPCIRGMRITVYDVLSYLASGMTYEEVLSDFPYLTRQDILASLQYAAERERTSTASAS